MDVDAFAYLDCIINLEEMKKWKEYYDRLPSNPFGETVEEQLLTLENAQLRIVRRLLALERWVKEHD